MKSQSRTVKRSHALAENDEHGEGMLFMGGMCPNLPQNSYPGVKIPTRNDWRRAAPVAWQEAPAGPIVLIVYDEHSGVMLSLERCLCTRMRMAIRASSF